MNRNMISLDNSFINEFPHRTGEQPRKLMVRKNKRKNTFSNVENEDDEINKHRQNYKRASAKYTTRAQWRSSDVLNSH